MLIYPFAANHLDGCRRSHRHVPIVHIRADIVAYKEQVDKLPLVQFYCKIL